MKDLFEITPHQLAKLFLQTNSDNYDRITQPLYFHTAGPYLFAMDMKSSHPTLFLYEFLDIEACLDAPGKLPEAFNDDDFLVMALTALRLDTGATPPEKPAYQFRKVVSRTVTCQSHAQAFYRKAPEMSSRIFFMTSTGGLTSVAGLLSELLGQK